MAFTRPLRSLRNRLALIFALIVLAAFGGIYVYVTPTLQERLIDQKLEDLTVDAKRFTRGIDQIVGTSVSTASVKRRVQSAATRAGSEVTLLGLVSGADNMFLVFSDSTPGGATLGDMQSVAEEAVATKRPAASTGATRIGQLAFVGVPLIRDKQVRYVVVYSDVLTDVQGTVSVVRERILVSGAVVLLIAGLAGYLVARALAARVERLEQAARKVAAGDFSTRIEVDSDDELGHLAPPLEHLPPQ